MSGATLTIFVQRYDVVFFVPGNHELWYMGKYGAHEPAAHAEAQRRTETPPERSSLDKFLAIIRMCASAFPPLLTVFQQV